MKIRHLAALTAVTAVLLAACGGGTDTPDDPAPATTTPADPAETETGTEPVGEASPSPTPTGEPTSAGSGAAAYLLLDDGEHGGPHLVPVWVDGATTVAEGFDALLAGPAVADPAGAAMSSAVPEGTTVNAVEVADGVARVDLSGEFDDGGGSTTMFARLAQVVYTATQFPDVDGVELLIDGEVVEVFSSEGIVLDQPLDRGDALDTGIVPKLFVDRPAWGQEVAPTFTATGVARDLFEATFVYEVSDSEDEVFTRGPVTAEGSQGWNAFTATVETGITEPRDAFLTVFEESMEDGSTIYLRMIPISVSAQE